MRIHIIACRVLTRELSYLAATGPHMVEITWLPQGLHETPDLLRKSVADALKTLYDGIASGQVKYAPDAIVLGYGLCSNGVLGLESRGIPLVVPRTDDCIALLLGAQRRYLDLFATHGGTYWLSGGWIETSTGTPEERCATREKKYRDYVERFDEDNAEYLLEQEDLWRKNYNTCAYIASEVYDSPAYENIAREMAREYGWGFETHQGSLRLLTKLLRGEWNDEEFCVCPPFHRLEAAYDGTKMRAVPLERGSAV